MLIFGPEKSVRLRKTHEDVYGKLTRDFLGEKKNLFRGLSRNERKLPCSSISCIPRKKQNSDCHSQPRPQGLLAFQYGGGRREDPGTQRTKTIADWCIPWCVHTCALIGLFLPKQRWLTFEGFVEAEKCFLQCLRPKRWTEFRSDCSENCDCTVGRQRFDDSDI